MGEEKKKEKKATKNALVGCHSLFKNYISSTQEVILLCATKSQIDPPPPPLPVDFSYNTIIIWKGLSARSNYLWRVHNNIVTDVLEKCQAENWRR